MACAEAPKSRHTVTRCIDCAKQQFACQHSKLYNQRMTKTEARTRAEAARLGAKRYFTGKPCSKGHIADRHLTGTCVVCARDAVKRWELRNPGEQARRSAKWQRDNPERARAKNLAWRRKKDGLPEATRPAPLNCECCGCVLHGGAQMHLDHCHKTGKFRGWLCNRCNRGLGYFDDCIAGLERAIAYLKRAES